MQASELNVIRDEEIATHRQTIMLDNQMQVVDALQAIHHECSFAKFTGKVTIAYNQGGVANITTEHVKNDLQGLFDNEEDEATDED